VIRQQGDGFAPVFTPPAAPGYWNDPPLASTHFADFNGDGCRDVGYLANGYAIHYRADCPTARTTRARPAVSTPAQPAQRIKPRRGHRPRR
jgi:hypothetical protein